MTSSRGRAPVQREHEPLGGRLLPPLPAAVAAGRKAAPDYPGGSGSPHPQGDYIDARRRGILPPRSRVPAGPNTWTANRPCRNSRCNPLPGRRLNRWLPGGGKPMNGLKTAARMTGERDPDAEAELFERRAKRLFSAWRGRKARRIFPRRWRTF